MKPRVTALLALAAVVAVPAIASAATMRDDDMTPPVSEATILNGPIAGTATDDPAMNAADGEHAYLAEVCPTVLSSPGQYSSVLVTFCHESRG